MEVIRKSDLGRRFSERLGGRRFPLVGQWELTCRCNLKCVMCYTDVFNTPEKIRQELSCEEILRILDEIVEAGCLEMTFTGGEPFSRTDFPDIYRHAVKKGLRVTIFTNGTLVTPTVADRLAEYPPEMVSISFHGLDATSFDGITQGRGSYERCLDGVRLLRERGIRVVLKTLGMSVNEGEVVKIRKAAQALGLDHQIGFDMLPRLDGSLDTGVYRISPEGRQRVLASEEGLEECCDKQEEGKARTRTEKLCSGGKNRFHIDAYGSLQLCGGNRREGYDLRKGSFKEGFYEAMLKFPCPNKMRGGDMRSVP